MRLTSLIMSHLFFLSGWGGFGMGSRDGRLLVALLSCSEDSRIEIMCGVLAVLGSGRGASGSSASQPSVRESKSSCGDSEAGFHSSQTWWNHTLQGSFQSKLGLHGTICTWPKDASACWNNSLWWYNVTHVFISITSEFNDRSFNDGRFILALLSYVGRTCWASWDSLYL